MTGDSASILDVDLLAFEQVRAERRAVVDGVRRSLATGFVYTRHDLSESLLDSAYEMLREFFSQPRTQAAVRRARQPWPDRVHRPARRDRRVERRARLEGDAQLGPSAAGRATRCATRYPHRYGDQVLPEAAVPGIAKLLTTFHDRDRGSAARFLRVIAESIGCHESFFDEMTTDGATLTRAIRYPPMTEAPARPTCGPARTATST